MLKRSLVFGTPGHLCLQRGQVMFLPKGEGAEPRVIPLEDIGFVMLENPAISLTTQLVQRLNDNGTAIVFCDGKHHPDAMLLRFAGNNTHTEVLRSQIEAKQPLVKRLWQQVVTRKIENQASLLKRLNRPAVDALSRLAKDVKSGDPNNREGMAARLYWQHLFEVPGFIRDRERGGANTLLNYGYAVLRAAAARALVGSGLYCAIGLHHRNRYNAFCLADDFMEPYRPFVDQQVCAMPAADEDEPLTRETKHALLAILACDVQFEDKRRPLMVALSSSSASLARCLAGKEARLQYPGIP